MDQPIRAPFAMLDLSGPPRLRQAAGYRHPVSVAPDRYLTTGVRYRVLQPFLGYAVGEEIELVAHHYDPHNAAATWTFLGGIGGRSAQISELADAHVALLCDLEQYLVVIAPPR